MRRRVYAESEHRIPIVSKEDLQSVFLEVLDQCENHREAAKWLGIRKHTFTKLLNGAPGQKAISFNTYVNIRRALGGNAFEFAAPDDPMLEFVADEPGESDKDREQRESEAAAAAARLDRFDRCFQTDDSEIVWGNYDEWVKRETLRLERMARPVLFELWESEKYRPQLEQFLKNVGREPESQLPGKEDKRGWLALYRAVEPLAAAESTWKVERPWRELNTAQELDTYLNHALQREAIMLDRERDVVRVRKSRVPSSYWESMVTDFEPTWEEWILEQARLQDPHMQMKRPKVILRPRDPSTEKKNTEDSERD